MSNSKVLEPEKIVDFNINYYEVLGLEKGCLPEGKSTEEKKEITKLLDRAYRKSARRTHPDFGGSEDDFKLVVRAHTILSDEILRKYYETNGTYKPVMAGDGNIDAQAIDWKSLGTYRKHTLADTIGFSLFFKISEKKDDLNIVPAFRPADEYDNYEWDWALPDEEVKLALSLVHDESDVLRLTTGDNAEESLPFKIYICIPRAALYFLRGEEEKHTHEDGTIDVLNGKLSAATYSDYNLLETTMLQEAEDYINNKLAEDITSFRNGTLKEEQYKRDEESAQAQWVDTKKMKEIDTEILKAILRMKSVVGVQDEHADEFLDDMPDKLKKKK